MVKTVFQAFDAAFSNAEAFAIVDKDGQSVAKVIFKVGASVTCFLHIIGFEMEKGRAGGGGYDRKCAAFEQAAAKFFKSNELNFDSSDKAMQALSLCIDLQGVKWATKFSEEGFNVIQVI